MKRIRQAKRDAKELFRLCFVSGSLDEGRMRQVVERVSKSKNRNRLNVLAQLRRLVELDRAGTQPPSKAPHRCHRRCRPPSKLKYPACTDRADDSLHRQSGADRGDAYQSGQCCVRPQRTGQAGGAGGEFSVNGGPENSEKLRAITGRDDRGS